MVDLGPAIAGITGAVGVGAAVVRRGRKIAQVRTAWIEIREALSAVQALAERYNAAQADGNITHDEVQEILVQVQQTVRECVEAKDAMDRALG
mgnify:FL=1